MVLKQASISIHKILFPSFVVKYVRICFCDFHPITDLILRKTTPLNTDISILSYITLPQLVKNYNTVKKTTLLILMSTI